MSFGDFAVVAIAFGMSAILFASIWYDSGDGIGDADADAGRGRAIEAALGEGVVYRVAVGRPGPHRARVEVAGTVYGFPTGRDLAEWLATYGVTVARQGGATIYQTPEVCGAVEIGHPSLGRR